MRAPAQLALTRSEPSLRPRFSVFQPREAVLRPEVDIPRVLMVSAAAAAAAAGATLGEDVGIVRSGDAGVCVESFIATIDCV